MLMSMDVGLWMTMSISVKTDGVDGPPPCSIMLELADFELGTIMPLHHSTASLHKFLQLVSIGFSTKKNHPSIPDAWFPLG